jgi:hypothetical protein
MDLIKVLFDNSTLPETIEYKNYEHSAIEGKNLREENKIVEDLSEMVEVEKYNAFKAGFYTAMDLIIGGNAK